MKKLATFTASAAGLALLSTGAAITAPVGSGVAQAADKVSVVVYDRFEDQDGYTIADYGAKWSNSFGLGEMAAGGTRTFENGKFEARATPFTTYSDVSVFDHIKYFATSTRTFAVPERGSIKFAIDINAETPGTDPGRIVHGTYADGTPYAASTLEGQQAGATLHMIDFRTGQLFDWFVSGSTAFTLIERLPATVTGSPDGGTAETIYTQIIDEVPLRPGTHNVSIELIRGPSGRAVVEYRLDGQLVSKADRIGIPLDEQGVKYTGTYPSFGPGELLGEDLDAVSIGHGLFSLLDAFPFQHPELPELSVSIPREERIFGQGAKATFDNMIVTTTTK